MQNFASTLPSALEAGKRLLFSDVPMQYRQQYITHSRHPLNHEVLNLVKHSLGSPNQFAFGKRSCPTTHSFVQGWPKICAEGKGVAALRKLLRPVGKKYIPRSILAVS